MALTRIKTDQITDGEVKSADLDTDITLTGDLNVTDITMTGELNGPATFYIDPAPHDPDTDGATNGLVIIRGDLQVDGTTTTVNSTTMDVADLNITLASGAANAAAADGAGLTVDGASATLLYDGTNDLWQFNKNIKTDVGVTIATAAPSFVLQDAAGTYFHRLRLNASNSLIVERYDGTSTLSTLKLDETGDVQFYENNGGTPQVGMHWDYADGRLGIGDTGPDDTIHLNGGANESTGITIGNNNSTRLRLYHNDAAGSSYLTTDGMQTEQRLFIMSGNDLRLGSGGTVRVNITSGGDVYFYDTNTDVGMVWDASVGSDGALLVGGHTSLRSGSVGGGNDAQLSLESTNSHYASFIENQNSASGYALFIGKSRGTSAGDVDIVEDGDTAGSVTFIAADGTDLRPKIAEISAVVTAGTTPAQNQISGDLVFSTTNQGQNPTAHMRITNEGKVGIGTDDPSTKLEVDGEILATVLSYNNGTGSATSLSTSNLSSTLNSGSKGFQIITSASFTTKNASNNPWIFANDDGVDLYSSATKRVEVTDDGINVVSGSYRNGQVRHSIRPTLNLDFANSKELDPRITFYRDSIATYYDSKGVLRYANANEPRFDYDPDTGESKGLLIEEARTNNSPFSDHIFKGSQIQTYVYRNAIKAPNGRFEGALVRSVPSPTSVTCIIRGSNTSVTAGDAFNCSIYAKQSDYSGETDTQRFAIYNGPTNVAYSVATVTWSSGVPTISGSGSKKAYVGDGWYRFTITGTVPAGQSSISILYYVSTAGTGNKSVYLWGHQIECESTSSSFATSYIPSDTRFTSRSSVATYYDETGILKTAPVNLPRYGYNYDGRKWVETGLILEDASENYWTHSGLESSRSLIAATGSTTRTFFYDTAPNGLQEAVRIQWNNGYAYRVLSNTLGDSTPWAISFYIKPYSGIARFGFGGTFGSQYWTFNFDTLAVANSAAHANTTFQYGIIRDVGNGWYRVEITFLSTGASGYTEIQWSGTGSADYAIWGVQFEENVYTASSFIYAGSSTTTRSADVASSTAYTRDKDTADIDKKYIYDFYGYPYPEETTVFVEASMADAISNDGLRYPVQLSGANTNDANENILFYNASNDLLTARVMTTNSQNVIQDNSTNVIVADTPFKAAISLKNGAQAYAFDGVTEQTNTAAYDPPQINAMRIGGWCHGTSRLSGHVKKVSIYNTALTSSEITALTENN